MNIIDAAKQARVLGSSCVGQGEFLLALLSTANVGSSVLADLL